MKAESIVTIVSLVTAISGAAYFIDDRYASADEFRAEQLYTNNYHLDQEIQRAQDRLNQLLIIPAEQRRTWHREEILRLESLINRLINKRQKS